MLPSRGNPLGTRCRCRVSRVCSERQGAVFELRASAILPGCTGRLIACSPDAPFLGRIMYAIVQHGGHQYRVSSGDRLIVDRLPDDIGAVIGLEPVLLVSDGDGVRTGEAGLDGVRVAATVVAHHRGKKLRILTYKPKKRHRRTLGFRADLTELKVEGILARGEALPASVVIVAEPEAETGEAEAPVAN